jgi:hypothetical protein
MNRLLLLLLVTFISVPSFSQQHVLVLKKNGKTEKHYWLHSSFSFRTHNKVWRKGELVKIKTDSFTIIPTVVRMGMFLKDTLRFPAETYAVTDVFVLPKKGLLIDYRGGKFQIIRSAGTMNFYWLKSGLIFRLGAAGYVALTVINGLINSNLAFEGNGFLIAGGVFLGGVILKKAYKPVYYMGKKYTLEVNTY